jgi:hypothetical protein
LGGYSSQGWVAENPFAIAVQPRRIVESALFIEEGWSEPVSVILAESRGRTIYLGLDGESLHKRAQQADRSDEISELVRKDRTKKLVARIEAVRENIFLREEVYRQIAAAGHYATLEALASHFAGDDGNAGDAADLRALYVARMSLDPSPEVDPSSEEVPKLIEGLRRAIERAPDEAALYLLLGSAYERLESDDRLDYARACYRKTTELASWGDVADAAREALERVDGEH